MNSSRIKIGWLKWLTIILVAATIGVVLFRMAITIKPPVADLDNALSLERVQLGDDIYTCDDSWFKKNSYGLWEMYLKGSDFELGLKNGLLAREQIHSQEEVFVAKLQEMVASDNCLRFLKQVVVWMNRNLDDHIPIEYQREIYGVALQASDTFSFIGPAYQRILNYHAAHDIGHALQNMNLVACTAMGVNGGRSKDEKILVGRNFDFSMGDDFAREKIVAFYNPALGYQFVSITWGGMIGVVSGMNDQGLVVTLNAAKSGFPKSAKTPTSILARQILQYASTIEEAFSIAGQSETFVAESFLISSAMDNKTVVIEKSPDGMALYEPDGDVLILTNHFQSEEFKNSELTLKNKAEGASVYRWERTRELLEGETQHDEVSFAAILRDQDGQGGEPIGMGNEKAINQLIAHHSVIFKPHELKMWISTFPYQLGDYLCYDLNRVFADTTTVSGQLFTAGETIKEDPFLSSDAFRRFQAYTKGTTRLKNLIGEKQVEGLDDRDLRDYLQLNPRHYYPYFLVGEIYRLKGNNQLAREMYNESLIREIPRKVDREQVTKAMERLRK
ncbi:MAG: choloylglycine hydrolase [Bacteroidales bacterium]|nr:choloylglycine hydrolase [Bacteroidales bacterium]